MSETPLPPITLRIPGDWAHPRFLLERIPEGYRLSPDDLILPDGTKIEFSPLPPDEQFPEIFQSSCRRPASRGELEVLNRYTVNVCLTGPGGSFEAALDVMRAGAAIVRAGGAGVFIDNSALAYGGSDWIEMTDDGSPDAISFALTSLVRGDHEVYTMGMQTMGFPDLLMNAADVDERGDTLIQIIRYVCNGDRKIDVGHVLADEQRPLFQITARETSTFPADSVMHNPYGRLRIVSLKDVAGSN